MYLESIITTGEVRVDLRKNYGTIAVNMRSYKKDVYKRQEFGGVATIKDTKKKREIIVTNNETGETKTYLIPYGSRIKIMDGAVLEAGDELTEGSVNPHDILKIKGVRAVQDYLIQEVQRVYRLQGVETVSYTHLDVYKRQTLFLYRNPEPRSMVRV